MYSGVFQAFVLKTVLMRAVRMDQKSGLGNNDNELKDVIKLGRAEGNCGVVLSGLS